MGEQTPHGLLRHARFLRTADCSSPCSLGSGDRIGGARVPKAIPFVDGVLSADDSELRQFCALRVDCDRFGYGTMSHSKLLH
jgi:hypothetical protein